MCVCACEAREGKKGKSSHTRRREVVAGPRLRPLLRRRACQTPTTTRAADTQPPASQHSTCTWYTQAVYRRVVRQSVIHASHTESTRETTKSRAREGEKPFGFLVFLVGASFSFLSLHFGKKKERRGVVRASYGRGYVLGDGGVRGWGVIPHTSRP